MCVNYVQKAVLRGDAENIVSMCCLAVCKLRSG